MLSIGAIGGSGKAHLYYSMYCQEAGEAVGKWVGEGRGEMRLGGVVGADTMKALLAGFDAGRAKVFAGKKPRDELGNKLTKNAGRPDRRGGFDLTFSAPKSVSCVWAAGDQDTRERVEQAAEKAALDALSYLQKHEGFSRTGNGGTEKIRAKLLGSLFLHSSNREGEPNLHHHMVLKNLGYCEDGEWRTLDGMGIYKAKMAAGNIYKASLAHSLQKMGFGVEQTKDSFEVAGVSQTVRDRMSSRSKQIEAWLMEKYGVTRAQASSKQLSIASLETRQSKEAVENRRDFFVWQHQLREIGFDRASVKYLQLGPVRERFTRKVKEKSLMTALKSLTESHSTFNRRQLHSAVAKELIGKASPEQVQLALTDALNSSNVIKLGDDQYTSIGVQNMERDLVRTLNLRTGEGLHKVSPSSIDSVFEKFPTMSGEQKAALRHICDSDSAVSIVRGLAGAGKSFTMGAVADAYRNDGFKVIGLAPSNKAKIGLGESIKGPAFTLDSLAYSLKQGSKSLTAKDVLIIDEAAMASSITLRPIIREANKVGAKLIFVGDEKQLQPIGAGQMFKTLYEKLGGVELKEIYRQERVSEAGAILKVREGEVLDTLKFYSGRRGVDFDKLGQEEAFQKLYSIQKASHKLSSHVPVLATSKADLEQLNHEYRGFLVDKGFIKDKGLVLGSKEYSRGDQILFEETCRELGVSKGETARVLSVSRNGLKVKTQSGKTTTVKADQFQGFTYGYAMPKGKFNDERGLHIEKGVMAMREKIISDWGQFTKVNPGKSSLIIASTNQSVNDLNQRARQFAQKSGLVKEVRTVCLGTDLVFRFKAIEASKLAPISKDRSAVVSSMRDLKKHKTIALGIGDRVVMKETSRFDGYAKNDVATITEFSNGKIKLKADDREFYFNAAMDKHIDYGYAITAHKSQGDTVDRAFVAVDSKFFDQNIFYVAISRSRNASQIYSSRDFLGRLSDEDVAYLKVLKGERAKGEYFRLYRQKLANVIKGSSEKATSQDMVTKKELETRSRSERLTDSLRRLQRTLKPLEQRVKAASKKKRQKKLSAKMTIKN